MIIPFEVSIVPTTFIFLAILTPPATVNAPPFELSDTFVVDPILIPPETNKAPVDELVLGFVILICKDVSLNSKRLLTPSGLM